jgi:hypothetical protein
MCDDVSPFAKQAQGIRQGHRSGKTLGDPNITFDDIISKEFMKASICLSQHWRGVSLL